MVESLSLSLAAGRVRSLSTALWSLTHLTALHLSDNSLSRIPPDIAKLHNLVYLDLSSNKIRSLPAELGNMVSLRLVLPHIYIPQFGKKQRRASVSFVFGAVNITKHVCLSDKDG